MEKVISAATRSGNGRGGGGGVASVRAQGF